MTLKLSLSNLAILEWLSGKPAGDRVVARSSERVSKFYEASGASDGLQKLTRVYPSGDTAADEAFILRFGGRDNFDFSPLQEAAFLRTLNPLDRSSGSSGYQAFASRFIKDPFHYSSSVRLLTDAGRAWFQAHGASQLAAIREAAARAESDVSRLVLIGTSKLYTPELPDDIRRNLPEGMPIALPSRKVMVPMATARVVKQTSQRLYVRDVTKIPHDYFAYIPSPVSGYPPNQYVENDKIILDDASPHKVAAYLEAHRQYRAEMDELTAQMAQELLPIISNYASKLAQKWAEREDVLREITASADDAEATSTFKP